MLSFEDAPWTSAELAPRQEEAERDHEELVRYLCCAACKSPVAREEDQFQLPGSPETFTNPAGIQFTLTLLRRTATLDGEAETAAHSWFPGTAWSLAFCPRCGTHLGWRYRRLQPGEPAQFWGLSRAALVLSPG